MIVYRLRRRGKDQNKYFQKDKMSVNTGIIYLTEAAAKRAKSQIDITTYYRDGDGQRREKTIEEFDIIPFRMEEIE